MIQGGDYGSFLSMIISQLAPENVTGIHMNMVTALPPLKYGGPLNWMVLELLPFVFLTGKNHERLYPVHNFMLKMLDQTGYFHLQATRPNSLIGMDVHPVGVMAYIVEKFYTWADLPQRGTVEDQLNEVFGKDAMLDNVMMYWISGSLVSSARLYKEMIQDGALVAPAVALKEIVCPVGLVDAPGEIFRPPDFWVQARFKDLVQYSEFEEGGHFLAMEKPVLLAQDIVAFRDKVEGRE